MKDCLEEKILRLLDISLSKPAEGKQSETYVNVQTYPEQF